jgi:hypothetical protein
MVKILGLKIIYFVRSDAWCSDVVEFNPTCKWCVEGWNWHLYLCIVVIIHHEDDPIKVETFWCEFSE